MLKWFDLSIWALRFNCCIASNVLSIKFCLQNAKHCGLLKRAKCTRGAHFQSAERSAHVECLPTPGELWKYFKQHCDVPALRMHTWKDADLDSWRIWCRSISLHSVTIWIKAKFWSGYLFILQRAPCARPPLPTWMSWLLLTKVKIKKFCDDRRLKKRAQMGLSSQRRPRGNTGYDGNRRDEF